MGDTATHIADDHPPSRSRGWQRAVAVELVRGLLLAGVAGALIAMLLPARAPSLINAPPLPEGWSLAPWPYLRDQFDKGVSTRCAGPACALPIEITIRPKRGFCDCERGVYDDTHLREVGDLDLAGSVFTSRAPGEAIKVGDLNGRYQLHAALNGETAIAAALHRGCDVIAIVARGRGGPRVAEEMLAFLRREPVAAWLSALLKDAKTS